MQSFSPESSTALAWSELSSKLVARVVFAIKLNLVKSKLPGLCRANGLRHGCQGCSLGSAKGPCEDAREWACGGFERKNLILDKRTSPSSPSFFTRALDCLACVYRALGLFIRLTGLTACCSLLRHLAHGTHHPNHSTIFRKSSILPICFSYLLFSHSIPCFCHDESICRHVHSSQLLELTHGLEMLS